MIKERKSRFETTFVVSISMSNHKHNTKPTMTHHQNLKAIQNVGIASYSVLCTKYIINLTSLCFGFVIRLNTHFVRYNYAIQNEGSKNPVSRRSRHRGFNLCLSLLYLLDILWRAAPVAVSMTMPTAPLEVVS